MTTGKRKYKPGDVLSTKIAVSTNENTLNWINEQESISKSILNLINQYANGELLHIETVNKMLSFSNSQAVDENENSKAIRTQMKESSSLIENESEKNIRATQSTRKIGDIKSNIDKQQNMDNSRIVEKNNREDSEGKEQPLKREPTIRVPNRKLPFKPAEITKGVDKK